MSKGKDRASLVFSKMYIRHEGLGANLAKLDFLFCLTNHPFLQEMLVWKQEIELDSASKGKE